MNTVKKSNKNVYNCLQTPRYYRVTDTTHPRSAEQQYSYSYSSTSQTTRDSNNPYGSSRPERSSYTSTAERKSTAGPGGDYYTSERTSSTGSRPGDYSYSSTSTGRLPHGTNYRHFSYRV